MPVAFFGLVQKSHGAVSSRSGKFQDRIVICYCQDSVGFGAAVTFHTEKSWLTQGPHQAPGTQRKAFCRYFIVSSHQPYEVDTFITAVPPSTLP